MTLRSAAGRGVAPAAPGSAQCAARKPHAPQQGERCSLLPHEHWMPHSWVPWSLAIEIQSKQRDQHARTGRCDACPALGDPDGA